MFEINKTAARATFKSLLGQANHFLITILIGLEGVRNRETTLGSEFHTSWNPQNVGRSVERSRVFALDLALIRAVDALDTYMMRCRRRPCALAGQEFIAAMDGTGQKISMRLETFNSFLSPLPPHETAFLKLAIDWRNRRVHSLAKETLSQREFAQLHENEERFRTDFSGLEVTDLIKNYEQRIAPTFKEAAAIIRLTHNAVSHFDTQLLEALDVERYLMERLHILLVGPEEAQPTASPKQACQKIWGNPEKRRAKVVRTLRLIGVNETDETKGREVPLPFVEKLISMSQEDAIEIIEGIHVN